MHFMKTLYFTNQNGPPRPIFTSFFDEIKRPKRAKNDAQSGQNARKIAFSHVGLDYKKYLKINKKFYRPTEVDLLVADYTNAKKKLKWRPEISFKKLVIEMVESDLKNIKK